MHAVLRFAFLAAVAVQGVPAAADTRRCTGAIAAEGDSRVSVLYKCGQPLLTDSFCAPLYAGGSLQPTPTYIVGFPCQSVEEWLYDRGPGNLMATVRFRDGRVSSIRYERQPQ